MGPGPPGGTSGPAASSAGRAYGPIGSWTNRANHSRPRATTSISARPITCSWWETPRWFPKGAPASRTAGWIANTYCNPYPNGWIRQGNLRATDASCLESGKTYWYAVVAVGPDDQESDLSNEVSAVPAAGAATAPHIMITADGDKLPVVKAGGSFDFTPKVFGGQPPYRWEVLDKDSQPTALPASLNLKLDSTTGRISGTPEIDM